MGKKDKRGALYLKRKKMCEAEIEKINGAAHARAADDRHRGDGDQRGDGQRHEERRQGHAGRAPERRADTVGDLMGDIKEEMEVAGEISAAISAPANDVLNDDDLLNELNEMEELELESQLWARLRSPRCRCRPRRPPRSTSPRRPRRCRRRRRRRTRT
ncbi:hypothetical protein JL720_12464 [Aureococcus anophagefferens]|nr:hypothetical protein JL720_12464 [Aureococcus anophagefferens]